MPYDRNVFLNCPFDAEYRALMAALVFAVHDCGLRARSSLEESDSSQVRFEKIRAIVADCRFGIHDISRTELDPEHALPRFNMPLELGLFLGAKAFGRGRQKEKNCLVLDVEPYRYQKYCSDIAGQDVAAHGGDPIKAIRIVRDWLRTATEGSGAILPGGDRMADRYLAFQAVFPDMCKELGDTPESIIFNDYTTFVVAWLRENPW